MTDPAPVDLAILAAQTGADPVLQREVLMLFVADARSQVELIRSSALAERREAAHRLAGSAGAVGAIEVGRLATAVEAGQGDVAALDAAIAEAFRFIAAHLDAGGRIGDGD